MIKWKTKNITKLKENQIYNAKLHKFGITNYSGINSSFIDNVFSRCIRYADARCK